MVLIQGALMTVGALLGALSSPKSSSGAFSLPERSPSLSISKQFGQDEPMAMSPLMCIPAVDNVSIQDTGGTASSEVGSSRRRRQTSSTSCMSIDEVEAYTTNPLSPGPDSMDVDPPEFAAPFPVDPFGPTRCAASFPIVSATPVRDIPPMPTTSTCGLEASPISSVPFRFSLPIKPSWTAPHTPLCLLSTAGLPLQRPLSSGPMSGGITKCRRSSCPSTSKPTPTRSKRHSNAHKPTSRLADRISGHRHTAPMHRSERLSTAVSSSGFAGLTNNPPSLLERLSGPARLIDVDSPFPERV